MGLRLEFNRYKWMNDRERVTQVRQGHQTLLVGSLRSHKLLRELQTSLHITNLLFKGSMRGFLMDGNFV